MLRTVTALSFLASLAACGEAPADKELSERDMEQLMIYHGSPPSLPEHDATVSLHFNYGQFGLGLPFCTGTLIFDQWILTATIVDVETGTVSGSCRVDGTDLYAMVDEVSERLHDEPAQTQGGVGHG